MVINMQNKIRNFKKILITGVSGSGGSYLAEYILKNHKKVKVYGIYRKANQNNLKNIKSKSKLFKCDLNNYSRVKKLINKIKPDVIFHLASNADVKQSFIKPYEIVKNNVLITLNLLEVLRVIKSKSIIQICSTSEVYGDIDKKYNSKIKELSIFKPNNPYAVSKLFQDQISLNYFKNFGLKIIITRMFTYLNPRRKNLFASHWAYQINKISQGKQKYLFHGNLNSTRTIMDVRDAMRAYWLSACKCEVGQVYNIGSDYKMKIKNFLYILRKVSGVDFKPKLSKKLLRKSDIYYQIPNSKKFFKATGWKPKIKLKDSIKYLLAETKKLN